MAKDSFFFFSIPRLHRGFDQSSRGLTRLNKFALKLYIDPRTLWEQKDNEGTNLDADFESWGLSIVPH